MNLSPGPTSALEKWRARWPEWSIGAVFVPAARRDVAFAWLALLQEFTDAAWGGAEATPGLAKLAWWNEELLGWAQGARRHPLGEILLAREAPWDQLVPALRPLQSLRGALSLQSESEDLHAAAEAIAACEVAVLTSSGAVDIAAGAVCADLRREHALMHAATANLDNDARESAGSHCPRVRRLHSAFLRHRAQTAATAATAQPSSQLGTLLRAWRAARGGA